MNGLVFTAQTIFYSKCTFRVSACTLCEGICHWLWRKITKNWSKKIQIFLCSLKSRRKNLSRSQRTCIYYERFGFYGKNTTGHFWQNLSFSDKKGGKGQTALVGMTDGVMKFWKSSFSGLGVDRDLGFSRGRQGHRPPDDDDDEEEDDDVVEDNDGVEDNDNNYKDISALGLDRDLGFSLGHQGH